MINKIKQEWENIIFNAVFVILTFLFVIIFYKNIILTTVLIGLLSIIGLIEWKSKLTLIIFIFGAIFGVMAEIIAAYYNIWNYTFANFYDVPLWLFIVWGNATAFIYQTALESKKLGVKH